MSLVHMDHCCRATYAIYVMLCRRLALMPSTQRWRGSTPPSLRMARLVLAKHTP